METNKTTIAISNEVWNELNKKKTQRGQTFEDVLRKLLKMEKEE